MADDLYTAADERARDARRAGLQAKKDEQPLNTTRSYASKQREWKVRSPSLPPHELLLTCLCRAGAVRRALHRMAPCTAGPTVSS